MRSSELDRVSFSGHETFPFRYTWLPKAVSVVSKDPSFFSRDDALVELGVGKNMVKSIRHWGLAAGVIAEVEGTRGRELGVTPLGARLFGEDGWDRYLEDPATLWLLHWEIASRPDRATTWYWVFSQFPGARFSKDELLAGLERVADESGSRASAASLGRDIDCFIRTYVPSRPSRGAPIEDTLDCPLVELGLVREVVRGEYMIQRNEQGGLPTELLAYAIIDFAERSETRVNTLSLEELAYAPGSPGRVFCINEDAYISKVERIGDATGRALTFDETAGLRQILRHGVADRLSVLERYYKRALKQVG